jgi:aspartyl-tRNA(Asn)/glutamyl-tRNA(Gln) amidotransferase subunit A
MALATVGTDTGCSNRIPAAACGIVGLKPTLGEVSIDGVVPLSRTLDHVGPLAQSVTDACLVYHALMGDAAAQPPAPMPIHGLRLAVPRKYFCDLLDDEVRARFEEALERLRTAGAQIDDVEIQHAPDIAPVYLHIVMADAAAYHATALETMPEKYTPNVRLRLEMGRYVLGEDYVRALAGRERLRREVDAALSQHDALVLPALPIPAPAIGASTVRDRGVAEPVRNLMLRLTQPFNVTGHPAMAMRVERRPRACRARFSWWDSGSKRTLYSASPWHARRTSSEHGGATPEKHEVRYETTRAAPSHFELRILVLESLYRTGDPSPRSGIGGSGTAPEYPAAAPA